MLKDIRKAQGKRQSEIAREMQISNGYYSHLEQGIRPMSDELIFRMAKALGVSEQVIREEAAKKSQVSTPQTTWLSKIVINGSPLFDAFRFHLMASNMSVPKEESSISEGLVSFVVENIAKSIYAELDKNKNIVPTLMAEIVPILTAQLQKRRDKVF